MFLFILECSRPGYTLFILQTTHFYIYMYKKLLKVMISIPKSGTSSVIFYLDKISQFSTPYYIFELTNHTKEITLFTGTDTSDKPNYYNQFVWENGVTYSSTQSQFDLSSGTYFLNIYETEFERITNSASGSSIYQNEIRIEGEKIPDITYLEDTTNTTKYFE